MLADIFGRPGDGAHAHRTLGLATVDVLATLLAAVAVAVLLRRGSFVQRLAVTLPALVALGVAAHVVFGVPTALNRALGLA